MRPTRLTVAALAAVLAFAPAPVRAVETGAVLAAAVDGFIRPGYGALRSEARLMAELTGELCETPSPGAIQAAHEGFGRLVEAWSRIEIIRFGPIVEDNRLERIHFFPDRRGLGLRQVQAVLAEKDATATTAVALADKSVALQGLTALEYLLYGTATPSAAPSPTQSPTESRSPAPSSKPRGATRPGSPPASPTPARPTRTTGRRPKACRRCLASSSIRPSSSPTPASLRRSVTVSLRRGRNSRRTGAPG